VAHHEDGSRVALHGSDRVEIISPLYGTFMMEVQGEPTPIRKRRTVIGYTATLQKVTN
jgi:hypothetical protein